MTKYDFDLPPKASPEVIAEREGLADEVCRELERAGLPVHRGGLEAGPHDRPGADVHVDTFEDGGVYVDWNSAKELRDAALQLFEKGIDFTNPPELSSTTKMFTTRCRAPFSESSSRRDSKSKRQTASLTEPQSL